MISTNSVWVYHFREGNATMKDLLGGKGANLSEMSNIGLPVPPGFTITTDACRDYYASDQSLPQGLMDQVKAKLADVEKDLGKKFGDPDNPLLLSVRSGSKFSMPGMMDTILNLGLNEQTLKGMTAATGNERFAYDAYRRFITMFSDVVLGVRKERFEHMLTALKKRKGVAADNELEAEDLKGLAEDFLHLVQQETGEEFPTEPIRQLELAIEAVFRSWNNERAIVYRRRERIPDEIGTAVNVQAMVFGNLGSDSGTGVAFTRDPSTGEKSLYGEYLIDAQGEDVVAGIRTPLPISRLQEQMPEVYNEFVKYADKLEEQYKDMMDLEFTVEKGRLFMLQCRVGKRTGPAAVTIAVQMVSEGLIDKTEAIRRVTADHLDQLLHPRIDSDALESSGIKPVAKGLAASPGAAVGIAVFDADTAERLRNGGSKVILVREETNPDDVHGMLASQAVLTARGGKTSHAAVVARGFGIPCVAGCEAIHVDYENRAFTVGNVTIEEGDTITVDGSTGEVFAEELELIEPDIGGDFATLMEWSDEFRKLAVRANADNPRDAKIAIEFGAQGIGLCRTEHMFFEADRLPIVRDLILGKTDAQREAALQKLETVQQLDFEALFEVMDGKPVTIRLIDPPLHEFLPSYEDLLKEVTELRVSANITGGDAMKALLAEKTTLLKTVEGMKEQNPMMGLRGVRLSIILPGIVEMQTKAIIKAAIHVKKMGVSVLPEIMIPLVGHISELRFVKQRLEQVAKETLEEAGVDLPFLIGTMIEIPRAALTADEIAEEAEFFSFGTNDLTQMTFGFSRDDAEGKFLQHYVENKLLARNPFETIDQAGVGDLMRTAVKKGKATRSNLKCGICGEHGGDPDSIYFCHELGLDYVSCSPFRVPIARLSAAQAAIAEQRSPGNRNGQKAVDATA